MQPPTRTVLAILASCSLLLAPSCLFGSKTKTTYRGQYVNQQNFSLVQPGATEDEVISVFGEPTSRTASGDRETWRYHYTQATTKAGAVLFLFATSSETEHEGTVTVEFTDAVVTHVTRS